MNDPIEWTVSHGRADREVAHVGHCRICNWSYKSTERGQARNAADFHRETSHPETIPIGLLEV